MSVLLRLEDLKVHFRVPYGIVDIVSGAPRRMVRAVDGVSLELRRGETLGLVGESGCGKSTLGRAVLRLVEPTSGRVLFDGADVLQLDRPGLFTFRRRAQMVFQEPHASLNPRLTVAQTLGEALRVHRLCPAASIPRRVEELMATVGLSPDLAARRPAALSGGQCQRVGIARALALGPDLLIADEAVSALDVSIQAQVLNLLMSLQAEMHLTMMFISHDLGVVRHLCRTVAVMYLGRIVEYGPAEAIFRAPRHPYTQSLVDAIPQMDADAIAPTTVLAGEPPSPIDRPAGCAFHPRCPHAMDVCRREPGPPPFVTEGVRTWCHLYGHTGCELVRVARREPLLIDRPTLARNTPG